MELKQLPWALQMAEPDLHLRAALIVRILSLTTHY